KRNIPVIPVLVDGAELPKAEELPEPLRPLVRRQGTRLSHERFGTDVEHLVNSLAKIVLPTSNSTKAPKSRQRLDIKPLIQPAISASRKAIPVPDSAKPPATRNPASRRAYLSTGAYTRDAVRKFEGQYITFRPSLDGSPSLRCY